MKWNMGKRDVITPREPAAPVTGSVGGDLGVTGGHRSFHGGAAALYSFQGQTGNVKC